MSALRRTLIGLPIVVFCGLWVAARLVPVPTNLGVTRGQLAPCPDRPNCVCSQASDPQHGMEPLPRTEDKSADAIERIAARIQLMPRTTIVTRNDDYLRVEFRSRIFGFVDDVEFYAPPNEKVVHFRSASRLGHSDLGVNRRRMEQFK